MQHSLPCIQYRECVWVGLGGGGVLLLILLIHKGGNSIAMVKVPLQACIYRDHIPFLFRFWILHGTKFLCYEVLSIIWLFAPYEKSPFIYKISIALILFYLVCPISLLIRWFENWKYQLICMLIVWKEIIVSWSCTDSSWNSWWR